MVVTSIAEKWCGVSGGGRKDGSRHYTRVLSVLCDPNQPPDGPLAIFGTVGIPRRGDVYRTTDGGDYDPGAFALAAEAKPLGDFVWEVTVEYSTIVDEVPADEDPIMRPSKWRFGYQRIEDVSGKDWQGKPYKNTADEPLINLPGRPCHLLVLSITRNELVYDPLVLHAYLDAVNSDPFLGFAPGYAKIGTIEPSEPRYENATAYFEMLYRIEFHPRKWHPLELLNQGRRARPAAGQPDEPVQEANGVISGQLVLLAQDGTKLAPGAAEWYEDFTPYPEKEYSALNLV